MARITDKDRAVILEAILSGIVTKSSLPVLFAKVLNMACKDTKSEAGSIFLVKKGGKELAFASVLGHHSKTLKKMTLSAGKGVVGWTVKNGRSAIIPDAPNDPRYAPEISEKIKFPTRNLACVPIKIGSTCVGAVEIVNWVGDKPSDAKFERLKELARILGKAIAAAK